jgi:hypothetical protein
VTSHSHGAGPRPLTDSAGMEGHLLKLALLLAVAGFAAAYAAVFGER